MGTEMSPWSLKTRHFFCKNCQNIPLISMCCVALSHQKPHSGVVGQNIPLPSTRHVKYPPCTTTAGHPSCSESALASSRA